MLWVDVGLMDYDHQEPLHCHGDPSQRHMFLRGRIKILCVLTLQKTLNRFMKEVEIEYSVLEDS